MQRFAIPALAFALAATTPALASATGTPHAVPAAMLSGLQWRFIGPFRGGRVLAVAGVPGDMRHAYFGAVDGGIWETTNGGVTWAPIFDGEPVASIGALAIAPSDPKTIYAGTGEADMRSDITYGSGMYVSSDGGKTWAHRGLEDTRQIGRVIVDPHNANVAYVAALGHAYASNAERGVFKTTDGGRSWSKVLFLNNNTGAIGLAFDPRDSSTIYATLWQTRRPPWNIYPPSSGPGSGLYKSTDAGKNWTKLTGSGGLPGAVGKIGIAVASTGTRVYAMVDARDAKLGGLWRSDDAGATWTLVDGETRIWRRGWYFSHVAVDPHDANTVYVANTSMYRSRDGGKTFTTIKGDPTGDDFQAVWIDPDDSAHIILGSDQGTVISTDAGASWSTWYNQPTAQIYHVAVDHRFPYWVYGAQQDSGAVAVPSRSLHRRIANRDWKPMDAGGESGEVAPDPMRDAVLYGDTVTVQNINTNQERSLDPTLTRQDEVWRQTWTLPLVFSTAESHVLYFGRQRLFRTSDGGNHWTIISPDLSRPNPGIPANLDGPTIADNQGFTRRGVIYSIAPSPLRKGLIWAGTDDGKIWLTRNEGARWRDVTPPALTGWSKVGTIDASHFDTGTAYAAIDRHRLDDLHAYIYATHDSGATWTRADDGIPLGAYVNAVREDPRHRGLLYAGTELGVFVSFDDGRNWQSLRLNMPIVSVRDLVVTGNDLVIATHGRGFYVLDDAAPLRELAAGSEGDNHLFAPALAYRARPGSDQGTYLPPEEPSASNPPYGAILDYYLAPTPASPVRLEIRDAAGRIVRAWSSADRPERIDPSKLTYMPMWATTAAAFPGDSGAHRFVWNLHEGADDGVWVPPGTYRVTLRVNGRAYERTLRVAEDPTVHASTADLVAEYALARAIGAAQARAADARKRATGARAKAPDASTQRALDAIIGSAPVNHPDDSVGRPPTDFNSLRYLSTALGNVLTAVESGDAAPTADMRTAFARLNVRLNATLARLAALTR
jgi:photosystem II stability/assembly factor-like uncharacterized protein